MRHENGQQYHGVWPEKWPKTRYSGPAEYHCVLMPAVLWEIESSAALHNVQFTIRQKYVASFERKGNFTRVKVKVHANSLIETTHGLV